MLRSVNRVSAGHGWRWVKRGVAVFRKDPALWLAMAFVYLAIALVLGLIPFIGWLILVLFTPLCMLGALPVAQTLSRPVEAGAVFPPLPPDVESTPPAQRDFQYWVQQLREQLRRAARTLFQGLSEEDKLLPVMVIGTLLLGGVVVIKILAQLLRVGGAALPAMLSGSVSLTVWLTALIGLLVVLSLQALLLMAFLYTVPLITFRREHPLPSIELSFSGTAKNMGAFSIFATVFAVVAEAMRMLFLQLVFPFDYLAFILIGLVALPVFIAALHASYQDLYTSPPAG